MDRRNTKQRLRYRRTGSAMLLVMIAVAAAFVIGLSFLSSATTMTGTAQTLYHHAQARALAESGIALAQRYAQQADDWRTAQPVGSWVSDFALDGGTVSISAAFDPAAASGPLVVNDSSFEQTIGQLATPLLAPPMSGIIGGWEVQRTALLQTGPTVPRIGVVAAADATAGLNVAFVSFDASVTGSGTLGQNLVSTLVPNATYNLVADIAPGSLPILDNRFGLRVRAGGVVVASSEHAATFVLPALPDQLPTPPAQLPTSPEVQSVLNIVGLGGLFSRYTLEFTTRASPPAGPLRIELYATSTGLFTQVRFDNVHLQMASTDPLVITAVGRCQQSSHRVIATLAPPQMRIVRWLEP